MLRIARNTAEKVELGQELAPEDVVLNTDYAYPAYGVPSEETNEAIRLAARTEGMMTDPVYEGKSMQGMIDLAGISCHGLRDVHWLEANEYQATSERVRLRAHVHNRRLSWS